MRDIAGRQTQCVQFGELGVRWYPGQGGLQPREGFRQNAHPGSLSGVSRVPLHLLALLLCHTLRCRFPGRLPFFARRLSPVVVCASSLAIWALFCALVGVFTGRAKLQDAVQEFVVDIAERPGGHGELPPVGAGSKHGSRKLRLQRMGWRTLWWCVHGTLTVRGQDRKEQFLSPWPKRALPNTGRRHWCWTYSLVPKGFQDPKGPWMVLW